MFRQCVLTLPCFCLEPPRQKAIPSFLAASLRVHRIPRNSLLIPGLTKQLMRASADRMVSLPAKQREDVNVGHQVIAARRTSQRRTGALSQRISSTFSGLVARTCQNSNAAAPRVEATATKLSIQHGSDFLPDQRTPGSSERLAANWFDIIVDGSKPIAADC